MLSERKRQLAKRHMQYSGVQVSLKNTKHLLFMNTLHVPLHTQWKYKNRHRNESRFRKVVTWGKEKEREFLCYCCKVPKQIWQTVNNKIRLILSFVLSYVFLKFYYLNCKLF